MRVHLVVAVLVVTLSAWLGHDRQRVLAPALEPAVDAEKAEAWAWVTYINRFDAQSGMSLHLRGQKYVLRIYSWTGSAFASAGFWEPVDGGIRLFDYWTDHSRVENLDSWHRISAGAPTRLSWKIGHKPEQRAAEREPSIAGIQPGDPARPRFSLAFDERPDHIWDCEDGRIRMVSGVQLQLAGQRFQRGISLDRLAKILGAPFDCFGIEGVGLNYLMWHYGDFLILAAVGPDGKVERFGLR